MKRIHFRCTAVPSLAVLLSMFFAPAAKADAVFQTVNETLAPGNFFWATDNIGWYWTPAADVELTGIQTRLQSGFSNINNNFTFTTTLYTDRPANGGSALGTFDWNGVTPVEGPWLGGSFANAVALTGGTTYFVGMSGWDQAVGWAGANSGAGVNWIDPPTQAGAENLGAGSGYTGVDFAVQMNNGVDPANIDSPILRFIEVPEPGTLVILAAASLTLLRRSAK